MSFDSIIMLSGLVIGVGLICYAILTPVDKLMKRRSDSSDGLVIRFDEDDD